MARFFAVLVFLCSNAFASDPLIELVSNPKMWREFQWDSADKSQLWNLPDWSASTERTTKYSFVAKRQFSFLDAEFTASQIKYNSGKNPWELTLITSNGDSEYCDKLRDWATALYGKPVTLEVIAPYDEKGTTYRTTAHQYDLRNTRLQVQCMGITYENARSIGFAQLHYGVPSRLRGVVPLVGLSCSQSISTDAVRYLPIAPLALFIDSYNEVVRNPTLAWLGTNTEITPTQIKFSAKTDAVAYDYRIDRLSGELYAEVTGVSKPVNAKIRGQCEKADIAKPKF